VDERQRLRELARYSRRVHARGFAALAATAALVPALAVVGSWRPAWSTAAAYAATFTAGTLLVLFMHAAGQERGAFRRAFRQLKR
jgi:hypothetical protein